MGKYKRTSERKLIFTQEKLNEANKMIAAGHSQRQVAKHLGTNECTLRKRLKAGTVPTSLGRFRNAFTVDMENELAEHCRQLDSRFYGLTRRQLMKLAFEFAELKGVSSRFNCSKKIAGKEWVVGFCKRQGLSLRNPEHCSLARAMGFNKVQVEIFFGNLKNCYEQYKFPPNRILNMDESGFSTVPNKSPKVISTKGKKTVCKVSSGERGQLVTAVCCLSASGFYVPPALIFARKRMNPELFKDAPYATLPLISETGYMNSDIFIDWLKHFTFHVKPTKEDPVLLILDNHASHCSLPAVLFCRENNITLLSLPPHSSHKIQPLDKCFFGPLKVAYAQEVDKWLVTHPGQAVTQKQVGALFHAAYSRIATLEKAERAFSSTGIFPYNPDVFSDEDFAPAEVTYRIEATETDNFAENAIEPAYSTVQSSTNIVERTEDILANSSNTVLSAEHIHYQENDSNSAPSQRSLQGIESIHPLPKNQNEKKRHRAHQKSEVLSATPFKNCLLQKEKEKLEKEERKNQRNKRKMENAAKKLDFSKPSTSKKASLPKSVKTNKETFCGGCGESFEEDWVQCGSCSEWWHEACSVYDEIGPFVCDNC